MNNRMGVTLLAPLAGAAIIAVLAIPLSLGFVAVTAGREDAQREARFLATSFSGYLGSLASIEYHRLVGTDWDKTAPPPDQVVLAVNGQDIRQIWRGSGSDAAEVPTSFLQRESLIIVADLSSEAAQPGFPGSVSRLAWRGDKASLFVAAHDPAHRRDLVSVKPIDSAFLNSGIGQRFNLKDLKFYPATPPKRSGVSSAPITVNSGVGGGVITWRTQNLSSLILRDVLPIMTVAMLLLTGLGLWLFRRTRRLTQEVLTSQAHASHLALHDPLTGLANRALLANRADLAIEQRRRSGGLVAFLVLDLDRFKQVNDTLGHAAGDALIRLAAEHLLQICRSTDTVARLGGDEFALVANVANAEAAQQLAQRVVETLQGVFDVPGGRANLSVSVGLALVTDDRLDSVDAIRQADLALYRAKENGRGCYAMFEPAMDESLRLRRETEVDLRKTLAAGELDVFYQPQVATRSGKLHSVEALARWTHPTRGPISPAYFIPIAEESGLIYELGDFVMRRACLDGLRWPELKVAVNVSPCQLKTIGFPERCQRILDETGASANRIELEITEGVLLDQTEGVLQTIQRLRDMGFTIALDDFGTGYSSLNYLNVYAVDKIKIDRSFVERIGSHQDAEKVIRAIVRLGKALGLQVIAEGVETEAQRAELAASGCSMIQGYLHAEPTDAASIDRMVRPRVVRAA